MCCVSLLQTPGGWVLAPDVGETNELLAVGRGPAQHLMRKPADGAMMASLLFASHRARAIRSSQLPCRCHRPVLSRKANTAVVTVIILQKEKYT